MVYDTLEKVAALFVANFTTDLVALCAAKSVTAPATATIVKRKDANLHVDLNGQLPALCLYARAFTTQARMTQKRETVTLVGADYFIRGPEATLDTMEKQVELAAEAMLLTVDRCAGDSVTGIWGAGLGEGSIAGTLTDWEDAPGGDYQRLTTVTFSVNDRDEV